MKIYQRYLSPKSPLSERGLTIASLKVVYISNCADIISSINFLILQI